MLLSITTARLVWRFGVEKTFEMLKNAGFEAFDFYFSKEEGKPLADEKEIIEMAHEAKALALKYGLVCNQIHAPYRLLENEEYTLDNPHFREIVYAIRGAGALGAKYAVVHPFRHNDGRRDLHQLSYLGTMKWDNIIAELAKCGYNGDMNLKIPCYINKIPDGAILEALALAAKIGKDIINKFNRMGEKQ